MRNWNSYISTVTCHFPLILQLYRQINRKYITVYMDFLGKNLRPVNEMPIKYGISHFSKLIIIISQPTLHETITKWKKVIWKMSNYHKWCRRNILMDIHNISSMFFSLFSHYFAYCYRIATVRLFSTFNSKRWKLNFFPQRNDLKKSFMWK